MFSDKDLAIKFLEAQETLPTFHEGGDLPLLEDDNELMKFDSANDDKSSQQRDASDSDLNKS